VCAPTIDYAYISIYSQGMHDLFAIQQMLAQRFFLGYVGIGLQYIIGGGGRGGVFMAKMKANTKVVTMMRV